MDWAATRVQARGGRPKPAPQEAPNGYVLAAFMEGVKAENIRRVAIADQKYLAAVETAERYILGADAEAMFLFGEDVEQARKEFLLALEAAYRGSSDA